MLKNSDSQIPLSAVKLAAIVLAALVLNACSSLTKSDEPATSIWWLEPLAGNHSPAADASENHDKTHVLISVAVIPGLDTADILNLSPVAELSHYTGARWADELPELLTSLVGRTLEAQGVYQIVSRRNSRDLDRCVLRLDVAAFYAELNQTGGTDNVHIAYSGEYRCEGAPTRFLKFDKSTPVKTEKMNSIVASFQIGLNASLAQLLVQIQ